MTMAGAPLLSCAILFPEVAELTICLVLLSIYSEALRQYLCMHNKLKIELTGSSFIFHPEHLECFGRH